MENYFPTKIQLFKPVEELEFTDDYMFCTILEEHKDICKEIIEGEIGLEFRGENILGCGARL